MLIKKSLLFVASLGLTTVIFAAPTTTNNACEVLAGKNLSGSVTLHSKQGKNSYDATLNITNATAGPAGENYQITGSMTVSENGSSSTFTLTSGKSTCSLSGSQYVIEFNAKDEDGNRLDWYSQQSTSDSTLRGSGNYFPKSGTMGLYVGEFPGL